MVYPHLDKLKRVRNCETIHNVQSSRSRKIVRESRINEIKHVQNEKPLREFTHKYHRKKKKTSGQIDEVEKFVQSDVRKINITDNIRFSRYLFLEQLNNKSSRSLSPYRL